MAWYRCGGGGVPASLKHDMNVVLNKKFNSLDDYDPKEWPELTNLLGKLPEKTASGSIAHITDGADEVPIKSCEVALSPSLDGYSSVTVHHTDGQTSPVFSEDYTASLGRTIYGGTADIVNGEGTETYPTIQVGELTFAKVATHTFRCNNFDRVFGNGKYNIFSSQFATYTQGHSTASNIATLEQGNDNTIFLNGGSGTFYISTDSSFDDKTVADFITAYGSIILIYETTTPTDFTFTPITPTPETALGVNNFWSDSGDTEVTYRADINLALGGQ
jgi:hypothetical protein